MIDAIGDPRTLATALDFSGGFISEVQRTWAARSRSSSSTGSEIATTVKAKRPQYAQPGPTG